MRLSFVLAVLLIVAISAPVHSAVPTKISYQGILRDGGGNIVSDANYLMTFRIYAAASGGSALWTESQTLYVQAGVFNAILGSVLPINLAFDVPYWLGVAISGGAELEPRQSLVSSPYAFHATVSDSATGAVGAVVAGEGLTGGGGSGQVTIALGDGGVTQAKIATGAVTGAKIPDDAIEFRHIGPNQAASGQVMKWNGTAWVAADDYGTAGPISAIVTDPSICCGGDHGEVHLTISPGGVQTAMIGNQAVTGAKIAPNAVATGALADAAVTSAKIVDGGVVNSDLGDNSITTYKIAAGGVEGTDLADNSVTSAKIVDGTIAAVDLATSAVTSDKIADLGVATGDLAELAVTKAKLAALAVDTSKLDTNAVTTAKIADGAVGSTDLGSGAVTTTSIADGTIAATDLADGSVTSVKIADGTIAAVDLASSAVTSDKIADLSIASADLAASAVTTAKLIDSAVDAAKLGSDAVSSSKITDGSILFSDIGANGAATGQVMKWNGAAWAAADDNAGAGGDITAVNAGEGLAGGGTSGDVTLTVQFAGNGSATTASRSDHNHDADYVNEGQAGSVNSMMITDGQVGTTDIAADAVTTAKIATNAVQSSDIGPNAVTTNKIQDATILFADINQNGASSGQVIKWDGTAWTAGNDNTGGGGGGGWADDGAIVRLESSTDWVGIGTSTPQTNLDVAGKATIGLTNSNSGPFGFAVGEGQIVSGDHATITGGRQNTASGAYSFVGGGGGVSPNLSNQATGSHSTIGGGGGNRATGRYTVISGGGGDADSSNTAEGHHGVIGGGGGNRAGHYFNVHDEIDFATVGGGFHNEAARRGSTVTGGIYNFAGPIRPEDPNQGLYATVGGGGGNQAIGQYSFIGGGGFQSPVSANFAGGDWSVITGGSNNLVGVRNPMLSTRGHYAAIGGGLANTAYGMYATIPGGFLNRAVGDYSFAAGQQAKARHNGTIVLAANSTNTVPDSVWTGREEQMVLRADGGMYITNQAGVAPDAPTRLINTSTGAYLSSTGQWTNSSDRNLKTDFTEVDRQHLLDQLDALPVTTWRFKNEDGRVRHIGPVAQDFYKAFGLGDDDRAIGTLDVGGVSLAAIQQLHRTAQERERQVRALEARVGELETLVRTLLADRAESRGPGSGLNPGGR